MVILTVSYMVATGVQSWRLRTICQKIAKVLDSKNSVVFLRSSDGSSAGITAALASSDLCVNSGEASVVDCFWSNELGQGISVAPKQKIFLNPFISFPQSPTHIPFKFSLNDDTPNSSSGDVYTLIEADLLPLSDIQALPLEIETFGKLVAWKIDTRLSVVMKTDTKSFSRFVFNSFVQNNYMVNSNLPLVRIQTVSIYGTPQDFNEIVKHSRKDILQSEAQDWIKYVDGIKSLSVLACQASEFEIKKNLTEGKTGIVQPDLISSKNIEESLLNVVTSPDTPKKRMVSLEKTDKQIKGLKVHRAEEELLKSPLHPENSFLKFEIDAGVRQSPVKTPESPKFPTASPPAKSPTPSVKSKVSVEPQSPKFPSGSPAKFPASSTGNKPSIVKMEPKVVKIEPPQEAKPKEPVVESTKSFINMEKQELPAMVKKDVISPNKPKPLNFPLISPTPPISQEPGKMQPSNSIRRKKQQLIQAKPPNILVYSESPTTRDHVIKTLGSILQKNTYTVYPLNAQQVCSRVWLDNTSLLVVCGSVNGSEVGKIFLDFFFKGGKVLCLCSDLLGHVLPTYHTAEIREHELVQFSYGKWKNIKMMHHIFCYQPSPVRKHFSQESDEPPKERPSSAENPSVELRDQYGIAHNIKVQTLGTEDTWKTPSLLMVYTNNGGKIIFSQIHLEVDPSLYENDEMKYEILMKNDGLRHEIFGDVLSSHLGLSIMQIDDNKPTVYTKGFFLGRHELKFEVLEGLKSKMETPDTLKIDGLTVKFCGKNVDPPTPEAHCLPVMIHTCPDEFSTLEYYDTLQTEHVGRLLIYSKVLAGSMVLVDKVKYTHGFAVVPKELKLASGRGANQWLSPPGCLMFSLQLHIPLNTPLGGRIPLIQHLVATSVVRAIQKQPGYEVLDLGVKWPNDIYANSEVKIGGLIVNSLMEGEEAICNVGLGINFSNSTPTTCINDLISAYNKKNNKSLTLLTYEKTLARIFNEIEAILDRVQTGDLDYLYDLYYKCWLHSDSSITVLTKAGKEKAAKILGIDDYGFLKIQLDDTQQIESVQPDGNSFDMLRGLIVPKSQ